MKQSQRYTLALPRKKLGQFSERRKILIGLKAAFFTEAVAHKRAFDAGVPGDADIGIVIAHHPDSFQRNARTFGASENTLRLRLQLCNIASADDRDKQIGARQLSRKPRKQMINISRTLYS